MATPIVVYDGPIVTRQEALAQGFTYYFLGTICKHGHIDQRFTKTWQCAECNRIHSRAVGATSQGKAERRARHERDRDSGKLASDKRAYAAAHPGYNTRHAQKRRAALKSGHVSEEDIAKLRALSKKCHLCGKPFTADDPAVPDHVIPLNSPLGVHDISNLAMAHQSCNSAKQDKRTHLL